MNAFSRGRARPPVARLACAPSLLGVAVALGLLLAGCSTIELPRARPASAYSPRNYVSAETIPARVHRVAVLPLHADHWSASEIAGLEDALRAELGLMERFEIAALSRADLRNRFAVETFASSGALPVDFLARLRADFGADAVLFLDLAHYAPYQPIAIGLRAKLVTIDDATPIWSLDAIFDAARPEVATAARQFSTGEKRPGAAAEDNTGVLQSPARFAKYVGHAVFGTLPPRAAE